MAQLTGMVSNTQGHMSAPGAARQPGLPAATAPDIKFKSALLKLCAKHKLAAPTFEHSSVGPGKAPVFYCVVAMKMRDQPLQATSGGAATAEALACEAMLGQIKGA